GRGHAAVSRRVDRPRRAAVRLHVDRERAGPLDHGPRRAQGGRMTATVSAPPPPTDLPDWVTERSTSPRRRVANTAASVWMIGSVVVALVPLGFIAFYVVAKGLSVMSWSFLTRDLPIITSQPGGGIAPAIEGTLFLTFMAAVMAVPLGVLAAIYLNEYG